MSSARPHIQKWPSSSLLPKSPTDAEHNYAYSYLFNGFSYLPFTSNTSFSTCPVRFLKRLSFFSGLSQNLLMELIKKGVEPLLRDQSRPHHKIILEAIYRNVKHNTIISANLTFRRIQTCDVEISWKTSSSLLRLILQEQKKPTFKALCSL